MIQIQFIELFAILLTFDIADFPPKLPVRDPNETHLSLGEEEVESVVTT